MRRLSIRVKLTLVFGAAMAVVMSATGMFLYQRLGADLLRAIDLGLSARAQELVHQTALPPEPSGRGRLIERGETFSEIVQSDGAVVYSSASLRGRPLLRTTELARARTRPVFLSRATVPGLDERARLLALPSESNRVLIVGTTAEDRAEALRSLSAHLLVGGPLALLAACLGAYVLSAAVLRPVDAMRRRAAEISTMSPSERLPVGAARDEIAHLGETLNEMLTRLESGVARERRFVADASHEIRGPLANLRTELELALRRERTHAELEQAVRSAANETDRLSHLAENLLLIARFDQRRPLELQAVALDPVLQRIAERHPKLKWTPSNLDVRADPPRLEQAVENLVDNAERYGAVTVQATQSGDAVEVHVLDDGPGFPPEFLPRAFERFSRADESRPSGGAGLGLAIVAAIAQAHGGSSHAANRPAGGADVWLTCAAVR